MYSSALCVVKYFPIYTSLYISGYMGLPPKALCKGITWCSTTKHLLHNSPERNMKNSWENIGGSIRLISFSFSTMAQPRYYQENNRVIGKKKKKNSTKLHFNRLLWMQFPLRGTVVGICAVMITSRVFVFALQSSSKGWRKAGCLRRKMGNRGRPSATPAAVWSTWRWVRWSSACRRWASASTPPCLWRASCECVRERSEKVLMAINYQIIIIIHWGPEILRTKGEWELQQKWCTIYRTILGIIC